MTSFTGTSGKDILDPDTDKIVGFAGSLEDLRDAEGDVISGLGGNDSLVGSGRGDTVYGGSGNDTLDGNGWVYGDNYDSLYGGDGNDVVVAGGNYANIFGGKGDDRLTLSGFTGRAEGGTGADTITGIAGSLMTVTYASSGAGVKIDLEKGTASGGHASGDVLTSVYVLEGSNFGDTLKTANSGGIFSGLGGNDRLTGGDGRDYLYGGSGNDLVLGGAGDDHLRGGTGADTIKGGTGNDTVSFEGEAMAILIDLKTGTFGGGAKGDVYFSIEDWEGSDGRDTMRGGAGDDKFNGGDGNDILDGRAGNDFLTGGYDDGNDSLYGGSGDDHFFVSGTGRSVVKGGSGADDLYYNEVHTDYSDYQNHPQGIRYSLRLDLESGKGDLYNAELDQVYRTVLQVAGVEEISTSYGDDTLLGSNKAEYFDSSSGNDSLDGRGGNDTLDAGSGNDTLIGGAGGDLIRDDDGDDLMQGGTGNDTLEFVNGADTIDGGSGHDMLAAGDLFSDWTSAVIDLSRGRLTTDDGLEVSLKGIESVSLYYGTESAKIIGSKAANHLSGSSGDDTILGGDGNDTLEGGSGKDVLTGGAGRDTFVFSGRPAPGDEDRLTDFGTQDRIMLDNASAFAALGSSITAGELHIGASARDANDHLIYNSKTGALLFDIDGKGCEAAWLLADLGAGLTLNHQQFLIG